MTKRSSGWNHNVAYHRTLLAAIPPTCAHALDIGCGTGVLARSLAQRCSHVIGIDLGHEAIAEARLASAAVPNLRFVEGDATTYPFAPQSFNLITMVASLHHLPLEATIARVSTLLRPGGVLAIIGLYRPATVTDYALAAAALPASHALRMLRGYAPQDAAAAMTPPTTTLRQIRAALQLTFPAADVRRRLLFRYTLIAQKPHNSVQNSHRVR